MLKSLKRLSLVLLLLLILLLGVLIATQYQKEKQPKEKGIEVFVLDGDTIEILSNNHSERIRLYGIDCPEMDQPFGDKAKQFTSSLIAGKNVSIKPIGIDQYGRTIGIVYVDGINVNRALVENGLAWVYRKYCKESFCSEWLVLEKEARDRKIGLWSQEAIPPWKWRHGIKYLDKY